MQMLAVEVGVAELDSIPGFDHWSADHSAGWSCCQCSAAIFALSESFFEVTVVKSSSSSDVGVFLLWGGTGSRLMGLAGGGRLGGCVEVFMPGEFYKMNRLTELHLEGNRVATLGSEIHALTQLRILSISNNQIRTISTNQIPRILTYLYLEGNPFHCDSQMLPFLQFLNSTEEIMTDEDLCAPSHNGTAPASPLARCPAPCRCSFYQ
ncbi:uncharacterized protein CEXT_74081 [Caerostris extrusa]|uniref:Uncharacterized protein n=1 Tax=Caerostris extrusa TaxID=172846 RepID=A0AAV4XSS9_CAEEX|nr:uncharacterized protein CEXT_74081 [Caerostris extrusa]